MAGMNKWPLGLVIMARNKPKDRADYQGLPRVLKIRPGTTKRAAKMTKRQFIAISDVIVSLVNDGALNGAPNVLLRVLIDRLGSFCYSQGPRFDRVKFNEYIATRIATNILEGK